MPQQVRSLPRWVLALALLVVGVCLASAVAWFGQPPAPLLELDDTTSNPVLLQSFLASTRRVIRGPLVSDPGLQSLWNQPGRVFSYTLTNIDAATADDCEVRWTSIDRRRNRPVAERYWRYDDVLGWPDGLLIGAAVKDGALTGTIWTPLAGRTSNVDRYFVRLRLVCAGQELASDQSSTYRSVDDSNRARDDSNPARGIDPMR